MAPEDRQWINGPVILYALSEKIQCKEEFHTFCGRVGPAKHSTANNTSVTLLGKKKLEPQLQEFITLESHTGE